MKNRKIASINKKQDIKILDPLQPPLESSLGHLAYGHLSFEAWRLIKKKHHNEK